MSSSKNANNVSQSTGGQVFNSKLYKGFAQPIPTAKKIKANAKPETKESEAKILNKNKKKIEKEDEKPFISENLKDDNSEEE